MLLVVDALDVVEEKVDEGEERVELFVVPDKAAGLHRGVDVLRPARAEELEEQLVLEGGLAAREGDAAPGADVEGCVLLDLGHEVGAEIVLP